MHLCKHRRYRLLHGGLFSLAWILFISPVYAQDKPHEVHKEADSLQPNHLKEVILTTSKREFKLESPMPVQILSGKQLEKLNSLTVADAIRYFSGVQLKDYGGIGGLKTINVRSLGSAHTAVFYDGMSVANAQNGQVDLGKYTLDNIEAIELYNGQKSTIFQPARGFFASSTLYLKTKTPVFTSGKKANVKASVKTGSFGLFNPSVLYQQKITSTISLTASTEWLTADGKYKYRYQKKNGYDTTAVRQNGDIEALRSELNLHAKVGANGEASLKAYYYDSERGLPGAILANRYDYYQRQWDRNFFVHGSYQNTFSKKYELLANVKFSRDYSRYIDPDYKTLEGALDNRYYQNEFYASVVNQYTVKDWWKVSFATDFSINTLDANLYRFPYPTRYSYLGALSTEMHWQRLDIQANLLGAYVDEQVKYYQQGDSQHVFCPVVSASFQPFDSKNFRIRAFYKESFRMPTFNDLYYTFIGNSSLKPEFTTQYDFGTTYLIEPKKFLQSASFQADVYYNKVKDKIVAMPSSNLFRWTMMNLGVVDIRGLELNTNFVFRFPEQIFLDLGLSYTYQKAIDITPKGTTYGDQIPYTPRNSGTVTSSVNWKNWSVNYSFIYTGERYSQKANIPVNYVKPWYTSDMALIWDGKISKFPTKVSGEINNVFNQYYDVVLNFPMPGRNYRLTLSVNF
ncbi:TonB-dependent receptor plug domain-containing protein [Flavobacterium branchiicola]|uniref:TonB-dependent receptor plug domain-containing protein n=1 Tax=Flavobacterium branchiicola TaxID=1114875 RepID=A0ABV9PB30_9FLAO|nr:TonB-dependent receptor [Flavobacterium branchiicola]MBS7254268.1 TonB-dependent receptor [Flavobacterium branchiicola]